MVDGKSKEDIKEIRYHLYLLDVTVTLAVYSSLKPPSCYSLVQNCTSGEIFVVMNLMYHMTSRMTYVSYV